MTTHLHDQRIEVVVALLRESGARRILDLGCGDGPLSLRLAREPEVERVLALDLSTTALAVLRRALQALPAALGAKVEVVEGSMTEGGDAWTGFEAAVLLETIEHIEPDRLSAVERNVFGRARPATVVVTTPNSDFNPLLGVPDHRRRHPDHRFEWDRTKFRAWAEGVAARNAYRVACRDLAGEHPRLGGASQLALFRRA
ncbi:MAG: methyltransferase domain-containing protein [Tistlia sp.]|uniref:methyltransferase domain-containing protein n=1 Tax=Tistlia sp. TaxID=3057121 RepID=UPI0034A17983